MCRIPPIEYANKNARICELGKKNATVGLKKPEQSKCTKDAVQLTVILPGTKYL